jgi:Dihaem cytochrome c
VVDERGWFMMRLPSLVSLSGLWWMAVACGVHADGVRLPAQPLAAYAAECGACHMAYQPGLLPAASWQRVMGQLERHYGTDASLEPALVQQIGVWLGVHAGTYKRVSPVPPPQDRLTRSDWFVRKHRRIAPAVWTHPSVKSAAHCLACHTQADKGDYDDDRVRLPPGLSGFR